MNKLNFSLFFSVLIFVFAIFSGYLIHRESLFVNDSHFVKLAQSFISNDLFLSPNNLPAGDFVDFKGHQFLFFGPLPSVISVPFVLLGGDGFSQYYMSLASLILCFVLVFRITRRLEFDSSDSFWLANFFVFGTVLYFVGLVNISAYVVQAVAMPFLLLALLEYFGRKRWIIIGILVALAIATRVTLVGFVIFFVVEIIVGRKKLDYKKVLVMFLLPILLAITMLGIYNFRRFGSFIDTGYTKNETVIWNKGDNYKEGFWSIKHVSANLFVLLVKSFEPVKQDGVRFVLKFPYLKADGIGLAIWFTSPLFVYLIRAKRKEFTVPALATVIVVMIPSLVYFGIGIIQYGYRYSLDFMPLLFLILLTAFKKKLDTFAKALIFVGIAVNCLYMLSIWNSYPVFSFFKLL